MGWGASFATALASVGEAAKNAVNTAAATAQTAWNYTKQQSAKTLDSFGDWIGGSPPAGGEQSIQNLQPTDHALQPAQQCVAEAGQANSTAKAAETQVNAAFAKKDQFFTNSRPGRLLTPAQWLQESRSFRRPQPPARARSRPLLRCRLA